MLFYYFFNFYIRFLLNKIFFLIIQYKCGLDTPTQTCKRHLKKRYVLKPAWTEAHRQTRLHLVKVIGRLFQTNRKKLVRNKAYCMWQELLELLHCNPITGANIYIYIPSKTYHPKIFAHFYWNYSLWYYWILAEVQEGMIWVL